MAKIEKLVVPVKLEIKWSWKSTIFGILWYWLSGEMRTNKLITKASLRGYYIK